MEDYSGPASCDEGRSEPIVDLQTPLQFKAYKRRWYILVTLCILNCSNAMIWMTFASVADQTATFFGISLIQVNWLSQVYLVISIPVSLGASWMLDSCGLHPTLILASWLNISGSVLRIVAVLRTVEDAWRFPIMMGGQTLCAIVQPLVYYAPTKVAAVWFPEHQRATANMIGSMISSIGILIANILSPMIISKMNSLFWLMFIYTVPATIACFLATVGIRESAPPTPPSASAETSNSEPFLQGVKLSLKNKAQWILLLCSGSMIAIFTSFSTLVEQILCVKGYTNDFAGLCVALFNLFATIGSVIMGPFVDKTKKFTEVAKVSICLSSLCFTALAVVSQMRDQKAALGAFCSLFGFFGLSIYPILLEISAECTYPVGEATSSGMIYLSGQIQSAVYIVILQSLTTPLPDSSMSTCAIGAGTHLSWMVPMLVMAGMHCLASCCFVLLFHTEYRRLHVNPRPHQRKTPKMCLSTPETMRGR